MFNLLHTFGFINFFDTFNKSKSKEGEFDFSILWNLFSVFWGATMVLIWSIHHWKRWLISTGDYERTKSGYSPPNMVSSTPLARIWILDNFIKGHKPLPLVPTNDGHCEIFLFGWQLKFKIFTIVRFSMEVQPK